jgi:hypothetical protein
LNGPSIRLSVIRLVFLPHQLSSPGYCCIALVGQIAASMSIIQV